MPGSRAIGHTAVKGHPDETDVDPLPLPGFLIGRTHKGSQARVTWALDWILVGLVLIHESSFQETYLIEATLQECPF